MRLRRFPDNLRNRRRVVVGAAAATLTSVSLAVPAAAPAANSLGQGMFGISTGGVIQSQDPETMQRDLDEFARAGSRWVRIDINWDQIQAQGPASYDWGPIDRVVEAATARGLNVLGLIVYTPPWARPPGTGGSYPPDPEQYADFAARAAEHYSAMGVHAFEVWNEPNIERFWAPPDPAAYTRLLRAAYPAIKAADPQATVLSAGTAPAVSDGTNYSPADFLQGIYANGGGGYFDAVAHHPYCWPALPGEEQPWSAWHQMYGSSPSLRSVMSANGDAEKKVWATEFGAPTGGPNSVSEDRQAQMIRRAYSLWSTYDWGGPLFTYTGRDHGTDASTNENFFGLLRHDFTEKPSFAAYQRQVALADPPETEITSGPSGLTIDSTPTFEFTSSESPQQFECRVDSDPWSLCASPYTTTPLADGDHTFAARAVDADGVRDPTPATREFTIVITLPELNLVDPPAGSAMTDPAPDPSASAEPTAGDAGSATTDRTPDPSASAEPAAGDAGTPGGSPHEPAQDIAAARSSASASLANSTVTVKGRKVGLKLECAQAAACEGEAELSTGPGNATPKGMRLASRGKTMKLAKGDYFIDAGRTKRVKLTLTGAGRTLFSEQAKVRAKLILWSADGVRGTTPLKLRRQR
jgi:polysaccharide biosynthesis protein PslG